MINYTCKMCAGTLEIEDNKKICTCKFCGTSQTVPNLSNEKRARLYERAEHLRKNNEYDKAIAVIDEILNEDITDSEAYWLRTLCSYGIEYVDDTKTTKKVPTVNRTQYKSIFSNEDYKSAIKYAATEQIDIYQQEAKNIDYIQKGILRIAEKEKPFDVFISYKSSDENGNRTNDSVLANDLYHQLVQEGFNVFFSEITLENKLGKDYEPYIFAALNSAKVMIVLGTKIEYFNAVWVKNEWSRFINIMAEKGDRLLIPCYKNVDPINLPDEFAHLQLQDMNKLGFVTDLIRGIKKIVNKPKAIDAVNPAMLAQMQTVYLSPKYEEVFKRGLLALEFEEYNKACEFFRFAQNIDSKEINPHVYEVMANMQYKNIDQFEEYYKRLIDKANKTPDNSIMNITKYFNELRTQYESDNYFNINALSEEFINTTHLWLLKPYKEKILKELQSQKWVKLIEGYPEKEPELTEFYNRLKDYCNDKIAEAEIEDKNALEAYNKAYEKRVEILKERIKEMQAEADERKEKDYIAAKNKLKSLWVRKVSESKGNFKFIGEYKDAPKLYYKAQFKERLLYAITIAVPILIAIAAIITIIIVWG